MNRNSGRKSPGGDKGRGSDRNKNTPSRPARGAERGGKPEARFGAKGKSFGPDKPSGDRKPAPSRGKGFGAEKPFGDRKLSGRNKDFAPDKPNDKKFGGSKGGYNSNKPFNDRKPSGRSGEKPFGAKKFGDKPSRSSFSKPAFGNDKPAARGKSSYKDFASQKPSRNRDDFGYDDTPKKAFQESDDFDFDVEKFSKSNDSGKNKRPRLDPSKKTTSKYQQRKDNLTKTTSKKTDEVGSQAGIRLNKFIANSGMCSRREADIMIQNGVVSVNGKIMDELGYRVQPEDEVKFDGRTIIPEKPVYLLLNKPKDYITTAEDPQGRKTVMALIQGACKERVFPVGRLDRNTTGLLLFTNDGEMADKLMHPRKKIKKIYMVELDKNLKTEDLKQLREGIALEDGPIKPDVVEYADAPKPDKKVIGVEIHSGRNRIVRRMFEHFGYKVVKLDRVYLAGLTKKNLPRGEYRMLEPMEVNMLKML